MSHYTDWVKREVDKRNKAPNPPLGWEVVFANLVPYWTIEERDKLRREQQIVWTIFGWLFFLGAIVGFAFMIKLAWVLGQKGGL